MEKNIERHPFLKKTEELDELQKSQEKLAVKYNSLAEKWNQHYKDFSPAERLEIENELNTIKQSVHEICMHMDTIWNEVEVLLQRMAREN